MQCSFFSLLLNCEDNTYTQNLRVFIWTLAILSCSNLKGPFSGTNRKNIWWNRLHLVKMKKYNTSVSLTLNSRKIITQAWKQPPPLDFMYVFWMRECAFDYRWISTCMLIHILGSCEKSESRSQYTATKVLAAWS